MMLTGVRVLELGEHASIAGRLLAACGASVATLYPEGPAGDTSLGEWRTRFKAEISGIAIDHAAGDMDLILDGRPAGAPPVGVGNGVPVVRVTPLGEAGPWADRLRGAVGDDDDAIVQSLSGFAAVNGYDDPSAPPVVAGGRQAEVTGGVMGAVAALLLLNGAGRRAATSWHEALMVGHETEFSAWTARGERVVRCTGGPYVVDGGRPARYQRRCADGWLCAITPAMTTARWESLVGWLDSHGMAGPLAGEEWRKGLYRLEHEAEIAAVVNQFLAHMPVEQAMVEAQERDLPWGAIRRPGDNLAEEQFLGRPIFTTGAPWRVHEGPPSSRRPATSRARQSSLEGLRVLDFTWQIMGPTVTRILASAGADVVKVERSGKLDLMRLMAVGHSGLHRDGVGSPFFANLNAGKRSIDLDVRASRELVLRLVAACDVVVENFSSRVMERLGLSFDELQAVNPSVLYVSLSGFGHEGPLRDYDTWGPTAQALSGCTWLSQIPSMGDPAGYGYSYLDYLGGYAGAVGLLAALWATRRDGRARWVDVSQVEVGLLAASLAIEAPDALVLGRAGEEHGIADRFANDEQARWARTFVQDEDSSLWLERTPIRIDDSPLPVGPPLLGAVGEHTEEVLSSWLS